MDLNGDTMPNNTVVAVQFNETYNLNYTYSVDAVAKFHIVYERSDNDTTVVSRSTLDIATMKYL